MMVTIFTPSYNRGYILPKLYESLKSQTCTDFEWLIVDDGSSDNTSELVAEWISEDKLTIRYFRQQNGGKHRAINRGITEALGEWFYIVDSDDIVTPDAVEWIIREGEKIREDDHFTGLSGVRTYPDGKRIGGGKDFGTIDCTAVEIELKYKIKGDLAEVFKTEYLRNCPFPEFEGERFCPENLVWYRLARKYKMRYIHHPIYICEYLNDGLTANITKVRRNSPKASMTYYSELFHTEIPLAQKIKAAINFWRFANTVYVNNFRMLSPLSLICYPVGKLFRMKDCKEIIG